MEASRLYGHHGRIGLIVPANNSVIEPELWSVLPTGVAAYATRLLARGDLTPAAVRKMEARLEGAVSALAATGVDLIAYCDMVTSFIMEPDWNKRAVERISALSGVPAVSAWTSMHDALLRLGARRIALGTPYPQAIHALGPAFFRQNGFEVAAHATLDILAMREVPTVDRPRLERFVRGIDLAHCDALVLLATDLPTFNCINELEAELGLPIVSSNQALLWRTLTHLGVQPVRPVGSLFAISASRNSRSAARPGVPRA
jgi:maleate isomerase